MNKYFVVVPVYNEQKNIRRCIKNIQKYWAQIIVVNDGSTDKTKQILDRFRSVRTINLETNHGKGHAMMLGAKLAWKLKAKGVIFMDGDNQHNPLYIPKFVQILQFSDIVIGLRLLRTNIPLHRKIGNRFIAVVMHYMFSLTIPDIMCGFRGLTKRGFNQVKWRSQRYGVEAEMLTIIGRKHLPFRSLVVDSIYHDKYKGFSLKDGMKILLTLPEWKWSSR